MATARTFLGHYDNLVTKGGRKRLVLWAEIDGDDQAAIEEALGPDRHHSRNIPIAVAIGRAAEVLAVSLTERPVLPPTTNVDLTLDASSATIELTSAGPASPKPIRIGELVSRIAALHVRQSLYADAANTAPDLEHRAVARCAGDTAAAELVETIDALNGELRALAAGERQ